MKIKPQKSITFLKYFFSYIIILIVSLTGFYFTINFQLKQEYKKTYSVQNKLELDNLSTMISDGFMNINQTNMSIQNNIVLISSRYSTEGYAQYQAVLELKKHITGNSLVSDVFYINRSDKTVISTAYRVSEGDGNLYVKSRYGNDLLEIPYEKIFSSEKQSYIMTIISATDTLRIYIPPQNSDKYACLFIINENELESLINMCISPSLTSIALVDNDFKIMSSINEETLCKYLPEIQNDTAYQKDYEDSTIYVVPTRFNSLRLIALSGHQFVRQSMNTIFQKTYIVMGMVTLIGIIITFCSMRITYTPLRRLVKKITNNSNVHTEYLQSISQAFDDSQNKNEELKKKIKDYRLAIQKSILGSIVSPEQPDLLIRIEDFFNSEQPNCIFVAKFILKSTVTNNEILQSIQENLPPKAICIPVETHEQSFTVLINYPELKSIVSLFDSILLNQNVQIAVSDYSANPMDVARLYDNASLAAKFIENHHFISYDMVKEKFNTNEDFFYPYNIFDKLVKNLSDFEFDTAQNTVDELLETIDMENSPEFFVRCILIDTVTLIVSSINKNNIKLDKYSEVYFEALFLCRSSNYKETYPQIARHIKDILSIFSIEIVNNSIQISQVRQFIKDNYMSSNFSVAVLADQFDVSIAYMSYVFKKKSNMTLTDYIWVLRLQKAEDLLVNSDLPIDQISIQIGYDNPSSFRRKFKASTNQTPSEYRKIGRNEP